MINEVEPIKKLKPCPFCGQKARLLQSSECVGRFQFAIECPCGTLHGNYSSVKLAVEGWNERHGTGTAGEGE